MQYIIYQTEEGDRKITVIDGQPYYQSTGTSSALPNIWLPFIVCVGAHPIDMEMHTPKYSREYTLLHFPSEPGYLVKKRFENQVLTPEDEATWCFNILTKQKDLIKETKHYSDENKEETSSPPSVEERLFLKKDLINSLRLTKKSDLNKPAEVLIKNAGLSEAEIKKTQQLIPLDKKPAFKTSHPDIINHWLIQQGADIDKLVRDFPVSYKIIWKNAGKKYLPLIKRFENSRLIHVSDRERVNVWEESMKLEQVKAILTDYVGDSPVERFFKAHFDRHHIELVKNSLSDKKLDTAFKLITHVRCAAGNQLKIGGSLEKRLTFIEQSLIKTDEDAISAINSLWQWRDNNKVKDVISKPSLSA